MLTRFGAAVAPENSATRNWRGAGVLAIGSLVTGIFATWPTILHLPSRLPEDLEDPAYFVWQLGWLGHALRTDPTGLWTTNAFLGAKNTLAYTDVMLGYAPLAAVTTGTSSAIALYNILLILNAAAAFGGTYALAKILGSSRGGALVAAMAFALAPWRLSHERHLNVLSYGGVVVAFALLAYGYDWRLSKAAGNRQQEARPRFIVLGWLVAAWQLSLGFAVGLSFSYILLLILALAILIWFLHRPRKINWQVVRPTLLGGGIYALVGILMAVPFLRVAGYFPAAVRTEGAVNYHSPPLHGLVTPPSESWLWGDLLRSWRNGMQSPIEQTLLPGFLVLVLAVLGLFLSRWSGKARFLLGGSALVGMLLALGTHAPFGGRLSFLLLFNHAPGWNSVRTSGRIILWVSLALALLAAGFVTELGRRARTSQYDPLRIMTPTLAVMVLVIGVEGFGNAHNARVTNPPVQLSSLNSPVLVLPISRIGDYLVMAWSVDGFPTIANGGSGFDPPYQAQLRTSVASFPDAASVSYLRQRGVKTVVLMPSQNTVWSDASFRLTEGLGLTVRRQGKTLIYTL